MSSLTSLWSVLDSSASLWEFTEYFGTVVVIVGVIGEYLAEFHHISDNESKRRKFAKRSTLVLIIGLAVELLGLVRTSQLTAHTIAVLNEQAQLARSDASTANKIAKGFEGQIADANARAKNAEAELASANAASQDAVAKVAHANARIAEANVRAAEAVKAAETERLARVKIEERLRPRDLSAEQQERITSRLKQYPATPYELEVDPTPEAIHLLRIIDTMLRKSQWAPHESARNDLRMTLKLESGSRVEQGVSSGVTVLLAESLVPRYNLAVSSLVVALREEGIETAYTFLPNSDPSQDNVHIMVGSKE